MPNPGQELSSLDFESMLGGPLIAIVNAQAQAAVSTVNFIKEVGFRKVSDDQDPANSEVGEPIYVKFKYPREISPYQPRVGAGDGSISVINIVNGGTGYANAPNVVIDPPPQGGNQATAQAAIANGVVTGIAINNAGGGYTSNPGVTIDPSPQGENATATAIADTAEVPAEVRPMMLEVPILTMLPIPFIRIDLATIDFNAKINSVEYRKTDTSFKISGSLEAKAGWLWGSAKLKVSSSYKRNTQQGMNVERTYSMAVHIQANQEELPAGTEKILGILEDAIKGQPVAAPAPVLIQ